MSGWYYSDLWREQCGPITGSELKALNDEGVVNAETQVWKEGQEAWEPLRRHAGEILEVEDSRVAICAQSGRLLRTEDALPYGYAFVSPDAKRDFVQSLLETDRTLPREAVESEEKYIGFWWRMLGVVLDEAVKMVVMTLLAVTLFGVSALFVELEFSEGDFISSTIGSILTVLGLLLAYAGGAFYEIWMVGRYQGTLGKMVIGARVVNPDGTRISYLRSLGRWAAKSPISLEAVKSLPVTVFYLFIGLLAAGFSNGSPAFIIGSWFLALVLPVLFTATISSVFWMAALDPEKRALHDRIASTRVIAR